MRTRHRGVSAYEQACWFSREPAIHNSSIYSRLQMFVYAFWVFAVSQLSQHQNSIVLRASYEDVKKKSLRRTTLELHAFRTASHTLICNQSQAFLMLFVAAAPKSGVSKSWFELWHATKENNAFSCGKNRDNLSAHGTRVMESPSLPLSIISYC